MGYNRDVMVNTAVTIVPRLNGLELVGQKEIEVCQFAFELPGRKLPWPEKQLRAALTEQINMVMEKMRAAGMVRV